MKCDSLHKRLITALRIPGIELPAAFVKIYRNEQVVPVEVLANSTQDITLTSCQSLKQTLIGDVVCLTLENIGCVAAAISLGLVDPNDPNPMDGPRVYTEIMKEQACQKDEFQPPCPLDFTQGTVYAHKAAGRPEFGLFGPEDSGRFRDLKTAKRAVEDMTRIEPADTSAVFFFPPGYDDVEVLPDLVVYSLRPVELTRFIQAYQYMTGQRVEASMGGLRMVNSDLIARPFMTGRINVSTYCLGARLIAKFAETRMGIGIPFDLYEILVEGMERSQTGYPFASYPGATN